ncbi:sulfatase-like hydrolase/transferase [Roseiconus lacunae]|uniref:sulfatase-like hydrolase/transferase n=1 Tax=Roseiconus lacunae TaxID=2605694 RepID=UPI0011F1F13E|nr:sulfatase-like hydrolase/transferase [Roseiconus lacunae]
MNNTPLLLILLIVSIPLKNCCWGAERPPNLVLIIVDDLGYGDVSYQGAPDLETPHLDQLAAEGIVFTQMRANCTVCSPTRAAIMTARYADRSGVPGVIRTQPENSWGYLSPNLSTLADRLGDAGYHSAAIGKWHLGLRSPNTPLDRGFDFFHGFLGDMMDDYYTHLRGGINFMRLGRETIQPQGHATELFTDWAIDYVADRTALSDGDAESHQPFFLYLAYNAPHFPIQPPDEWLNKTQLAHLGMELKRAKNVAFVEHLDHNIGRFLRRLDELGLREKTVVAFTSDNGGSLPHAQRNLPWRDGKQSHYDGGLRVPMIVRSTDPSLAGTESDYIGLNFDLHATFVELAGAKPDPEADAVSLVPILQGKMMPKQTRELYFVRREGGNRYVGGAYHALIRGDWKLLRNDPYSPLQLYNLNDDPYETTDLIDQRPRVAKELKQSLRKHLQRGGRVPWQSPAE